MSIVSLRGYPLLSMARDRHSSYARRSCQTGSYAIAGQRAVPAMHNFFRLLQGRRVGRHGTLPTGSSNALIGKSTRIYRGLASGR